MMDRSQIAPLASGRPMTLGIARAASLAVVCLTALALLLMPNLLKQSDALLTQAVLPFLLLGLTACIAHGLGWRPRRSVLANATGPLVAWPLTLAAFAFLALGGVD